MPLYEYACQECGRQSELLVRSEASPCCPQCGSAKLSKLLSIVASPTRSDTPEGPKGMPPGACGSSCACFPQG